MLLRHGVPRALGGLVPLDAVKELLPFLYCILGMKTVFKELGAVVGLVLKSKNQLREGAFVPFGPFLSCAAIVLTLTGKQWVLL